MRAVCVRCGADKPEWDRVCPACGHRPEGDGLLVAWLLSASFLDPLQLDAAAARIRHGTPVRPSDRQLDTARRALGRHSAADPGLPPRARVGLFVVNVLLTPLIGFTVWAWWRSERPRAARQALQATLPAAVAGLMIVASSLYGAL